MQPQNISQFEQVAAIIRALPLEDYDRVRKLINEEEEKKRAKDEKLRTDIERWQKTDKWLAENRAEYMGQWVCLDGDQLIAHGTDGREVFRQAKELGIKSPFLEHIVEEPKFFTGGW